MKKRTKPVTRDEIRFRYWKLEAMPADAFHEREGEWRTEMVPIPELWRPLLRKLKREHKAYIEGPWKELVAHYESVGVGAGKPWDPPSLPKYVYESDERACHHCFKDFYRIGSHGRYCSDICAKEAARPARQRRIEKQTRIKTQKRAATRAGRECLTCGVPMEAARATKRYCSDRCRVAAHRNKAC
jgi:hypothetical protein